jgi:hypothetical protein
MADEDIGDEEEQQEEQAQTIQYYGKLHQKFLRRATTCL